MALATKPDPSPTPGERRESSYPRTWPHLPWHTCTHMHTHTYVNVYKLQQYIIQAKALRSPEPEFIQLSLTQDDTSAIGLECSFQSVLKWSILRLKRKG